jgi:hypothetical protein
VPRRDYEAALGRALEPADFDPGFAVDRAVSFDPTRIPLYAAIESVFLTLWFFVLARLLLWVRRPTAFLPALHPLWMVPFYFCEVYSPAFADADWCFQRVVVEHVALWGWALTVILFLPACVSALLCATLWAAEKVAASRNVSARAYRARALAGFAALCLVGTALRYGWPG